MVRTSERTRRIVSFLIAVVISLYGIIPTYAVKNTDDGDIKTESSSSGTESDKTKESESDGDDKADKDKSDDKSEKSNERKPGEKPVLGDGETGVLIDALSGNVIFEYDGGKRMYPASTTKIMTALLTLDAIERGETSLETQVEVSREVLDGLDPDGSNIALKEGEVISVENLLKGMLIQSGNDAARTLAVHVGKSEASFVDMMNAKATELGCSDTHFANPDGIHDDNHYTTAADMAKIAYAAMKYYEFRNIVDCAHIKIPQTNMSEERYYINTNGLLSAMRYTDYFYKYSNGIKTGYTQKAGNCLVSSATRDGMQFIGVLFGGKDVSASHKDSVKMLEYGFETCTPITPLGKGNLYCEVKVRQARGNDMVPLATASDVTVIVPKGTNTENLEIKTDLPKSIAAPVNTGDKVGEISVWYNGVKLSSCDLLAASSVERSFFWPVMALGDYLWSSIVVRVIVYMMIAGIIAFVIFFVYAMYRNIQRAKMRREMSRRKRR